MNFFCVQIEPVGAWLEGTLGLTRPRNRVRKLGAQTGEVEGLRIILNVSFSYDGSDQAFIFGFWHGVCIVGFPEGTECKTQPW